MLYTRKLFDLINSIGMEVITSQFVHKELSNASCPLKRSSIDLLNNYRIANPTSAQNKKISELVTAYLNDGILTKNSILDATHIAFATLLDVTAVISNNMRHMVKRQDRFNVVNLRMLNKTINIYNPEYVLRIYENGK